MGAAEKLNAELFIEETVTTSRQKVEKTFTEELFLGICAPIGSRKDDVIDILSKTLIEKYNYKVEKIKLSDFINEFQTSVLKNVDGKTKSYSNFIHKINEGNSIRKKYNNNSVLAELAIRKIFNDRANAFSTSENILPKTEELKSRRICYIIDSIKNKEELLLLRTIYNELFYLFSVFSPFEERKSNLSRNDLSQTEIDEIIGTDEYENNEHGQNVRGTFVEGDFFLRVSEKSISDLSLKIERYFHLIFETQVITPMPHENAMYEAKSAAGNSSCLSRQVGVAITDGIGSLISKGWNDVPKFGGNLYQEGNTPDHRCIFKGHCSNDTQKDILVESIVKSIINDTELNTIFKNGEENINLALVNNFSSKIRSGKIKDLIEYSRAVHAEMHAIISGSQLSGSKMIGGKLFSTTYPCHNCARHIIVAGIKEVYYIEPYVKSLCITLHDDAITENESDDQKVRILIYDGVAPRKYLNFFTNFNARKDKKGKLTEYDLTKVFPKMSKTLQALSTLEQQAIHSLSQCGIISAK